MTSVKETSGSPPAEATSESLLQRTATGDRGAFEELYRRMRTRVYALALATLKNREDAQDVLQDVFVALFQKADAYRGDGTAQSYILSMTARLCKMRLRERGRRADLDEEDWMPDLEDRALTPYQRLLLNECLTALDDEERQVLVLHAVSGMKHREIAKLLHKPLSTVLSKYNRAINKLQNKFGEGE